MDVEESSVLMLLNKGLKLTLVMMDQLPASEWPFRLALLCECIFKYEPS